jgi:hypothetical protein
LALGVGGGTANPASVRGGGRGGGGCVTDTETKAERVGECISVRDKEREREIDRGERERAGGRVTKREP